MIQHFVLVWYELNTDVDATSIYEYTIEKTTTITDPFNRPNKLKGYAYISTAHKKPAVHSRGVIGVLVMDYIHNSLSSEINTLTQDLIADGWEVFKEVIPSASGVSEVSSIIKEHHNKEG